MQSSHSATITKIREQLGNNLTIVGHHYQSDAVVQHTDLRGDSLELARKVANVTSDHIVFCGVYFMAESASLLARPNQHIYLPDLSANCSMAQMAPADYVRDILLLLCNNGRKVVPLTYVNSSLAVKDVVGEFGGAVCTSANAKVMLEWACKQGDAVLFLPDKSLGQNTAKSLGIAQDDMHILDIRGKGTQVDVQAANKAKIILWPGHCCIHTRFTLNHIATARTQYPGAKVVVHPESSPEVVDASDANGSTSAIINYVANAKAGSTVVIGTEINLVNRLAHEHAGRVTVVPLHKSACSHMEKTTEENLAVVLQSIVANTPTTEVVAPEAMRKNAKASLERMLAVCS